MGMTGQEWLEKYNKKKQESNTSSKESTGTTGKKLTGSQWLEKYTNKQEQTTSTISTDWDKYKEFANSEEGSQGWQKYLADQEASNQRAEAEEDDEKWWEKIGRWLGSGGAVDTSLPMGTTTQTIHSVRDTGLPDYTKPEDDWNDEQRNIFGYLYSSNPDEASKYAEYLNTEFKEKEKIKEIQDSATSNGWAGAAHTAGAIATAPLAMADFLNDLVLANAGVANTQYDGEVSPFEYSQAVTGGISEHLNETYGTINENIPIIGGKGWGDLYGLGTSIAQSAVSGYTMGGIGTLVSYFGQGAASGVDDALSRGASEGQAVLYGTVLGVAEGLAEQIGIDNLFKLGASPTLKVAIKNILKQAGAEGMEEGLTSIISNIADNAIMQDQSNFNAMVKAYMEQGMTEAKAKQKAWLDSIEGIAFDTLGGFVSGGVHAGAHTGVLSAIDNHKVSQEYGDNQSIQNLLSDAVNTGGEAGNVADKLLAKYEKKGKLSGANLNELIYTTDTTKMKMDIEAKLTEHGETGDVSAIADILVRQASGEELTAKDKRTLNNSKAGHLVSGQLNADNIKSGALHDDWATYIGTERLRPDVYNRGAYELAKMVADHKANIGKDSVAKELAESKGADEAKIEVSDNGKNMYYDAETDSYIDADIKSIVSTKGGIKVELENGKTVKASDLRFASREEGVVYEMLARMDVTPETANEILSTFKPSDANQADLYFDSIPLAYRMGLMGNEQGLKFIKLSDAQKRIVYNRGRIDATINAKERDKARATSTKNATAEASKTGKNGIIYEVGFVYDEANANDLQKAGIAGAEAIAKTTNLEVHVFSSKVEDGKRVAFVNGKKVSAPNGYFTDGNKIYIDISAGMNAEGAMLYALSHEVTHYIRKWNAQGFKDLADFLIAEYGKHGVDITGLISRQKDKIKKRYNDEGKTLPNDAKLFDMAYEELVSDAMSDMLADPKAYEKLAKLKKKNFKIWQKLGEVIKQVLDKLKNALNVYRKNSPVAQEAYHVRDFSKEAYNKLQDLYIKAFVEADANYGTLKGNEETVSDEVMHSERDDNVDTDSTEYKIRTSMTMAEAKRMIESAYKINNIAEYYEGEYKDAEDWLRKAGSDEVEMYIENDYDLQAKYINSNDDILNEEYRMSDVLDAYLSGTLIGKEKPKAKRLDVSQSTKLKDSRFYSPQKIEDAKATFELAKQKAVGKDATTINRARSEVLLFSHNKGAAELLGVTQAELNKKLRSWSNYSATARNISERINAGVAEENRWTGIENCSYISKARVSNEDIERLVESVEGDSKGYERKYIARVMLAVDTHMDYSKLKFKFATQQQVNADNNSGGRVLGFYRDDSRTIEVTHDKPNTVAHEMGHYIDAQWGRDLLGSDSSFVWLTSGVNADIVRERHGEQGVQFLKNFKLFINSLTDVNNNRDSYTNDRKEVFARFFAKFVEWTDNIATGNKYYSYESSLYSDKFTQAQYLEFAKLLQEKALLDGSLASEGIGKLSDRDNVKNDTINDGLVMYSFRDSESGMANDLLSPYDEELTRFIEQRGDYIVDSFDKLKQIVNLAFDNPDLKATAYFGIINTETLEKIKNSIPNLAKAVEEILFKEGKNYSIATTFDSIRHIVDEKALSRDEVISYLDRLADTILEFDSVTFDFYYSHGNKMPGLLFKKEFEDGTLVSFNLISHKKRSIVLHSLYLNNVDYQKKKAAKTLLMQNAPAHTPEARVGQPSANIISEDAEFVNSEFSDNDAMFSYRDDLKEAKSTLKTKYKVDSSEVVALADKYYNSYGGGMTKTEFTLHFVSIANKLAETFANGSDTALNSALEELTSLATEIASEPKGDDALSTKIREIKRYIRGIKIEIPRYNKGDFDVAGGFDNFRKRHFGKLNLGKVGINVDALYPELTGLFGDVWFPSDIEALPDQLLRIAEVVDTPVSSGYEVNYDVDEATEYTQASLYEEISAIIENSKKSQDNLYINNRDTDSVSNRTLLANALESVAQNDIEKAKLAQYKKKIALIESEQRKLNDLKARANSLRFTKGRTSAETNQMRDLDFEATQTANRINTYDKQLLNLESTKALKNVLEREKTILRKRLEQKGKEALSAQRAKNAETVREIMTRNTESRKAAVESRHKTEMRHKIKKVVSDLNKLLLNPTKEQHVPIGLQGVVADALDAINMDTMNAEERVKYYNDLIAKATNPDTIKELTRKRDFFEYRDMNFKERITALKNAYAEFKKSNDPLIRDAHNEAIEDLIEDTVDKVGDNSLKDMSYAQLEMVYDMYKAVLATVRNSNKMFQEGIKATVTENGEAVKVEVREVGGHKKYVLEVTEFLKKAGWNMLKPVTAMKVIGSKTLAKLFDNVRAAEDTWAVDVNEAKEFYKAVSDKYGYDKWDFKTRYDFKDSQGEDFSISLEQMMSLYAYSKREQADEHLEFGGFIFDDATVTKKTKLGISLKHKVNDVNPHRLGQIQMMEIIGKLTQEQKAFIDEMQTYLSDVMGAKGNEVSLALYDIKLYKEKNYFPLKTAKHFREFDPEKNGTPKIRNSGFSKKAIPNANNPIILSNFMDVWASHVNDMSMYHAFVLPLEDFMRVYNYQSTQGGYDSVKQYITNAYGSQANQYIERLMDDLNGGARVDTSAEPINKGISLFKRASVFASASVVVQQPSAIARAFAYIDPKYFATSVGSALNLKKHKEVWAEVRKYAPVAVIKEMGYFDTGMGRSTVEWIKGNKTIKDKMDDALSKAPAKADELSWSYIWLAVKNEIKSTTDLTPGSEEFLKKVGARFTEVITNTQVYDSVLARSGMMRSKDTGMKMATAFMAEPTTTVNMMVDGIIQGKRGNKKFTASTVGAISASVILNSILVALVYAARDDDEDETYTEKYVGSVTSELLDGFNPLTYIPFVKDAWSIAQGYDVERSDMSVVSNLWESIEGLFNDNKSGWEKVSDATGAVSSLFGIPLKNLIRDAKGMYNLTETLLSGTPTTGAGLSESIGDAFTSSIPLWDRLHDSDSNADRLYKAMVRGDQTQISRIKSRYANEQAFETAMRQALRDNDSRINEAAQARLDGDIAEYTRIAKEIIREGNFSQDIVVGAINAEMNAIKRGEITETEPTEDMDEVTSIYSGSDINSAFDNGDYALGKEIISDLIETKVANGMEEKNAKSSLRSTLTSYWKPLYKQAYHSGDTTEMARIRQILYASGLYGSANEVVKTTQSWLKS